MSSQPGIRQFAVVGNPIKHSRSPAIHQMFAAQTGVALEYSTLLSPLDGFAETVGQFFAAGGCGLNITVPFKEQAYVLSAKLSERARLAGAVNTLWQQDGQLNGCNTDGLGLLSDLQRLNAPLEGARILLIGAGGASKGVVYPLLNAGCARLHIVNRTEERAQAMRAHFSSQLPDYATRMSAGGLLQAEGEWDLVINATSSGLQDTAPELPGVRYAADALAYDMLYAALPTPFMRQAAEAGAHRCVDGLGMLVGQAAASFAIWNGMTPQLEPVLRELRRQLQEP
ncbi:shikimate dehydrogenase [Pusillimonas sp. CC-YST705]|uniref:Shikimate dehydrogenase (NADP(+)) n=1 Tax=Mesopusillimonas faecipullorum TaxID=2755040 RepID=A0ABS8C9D3_9BURK|nr:shikimate dehydrogenase [Mesopusillimonas faecipullorum]MCB5362641.1 shikimate dehydrogenase [Mesopusillimonas faecipullorum]